MGAATFPETLGRFGVGASSELILFMFLMSMIGGIGLIEARRLGVIRRILSTPTPGPLAVAHEVVRHVHPAPPRRLGMRRHHDAVGPRLGERRPHRKAHGRRP
jgi:hypothetical protein